MSLKACSLFAGIGGIDLAFRQVGFEIIWANEIDEAACKTYRYNFLNTVLTECDIRKINADDIPDFDMCNKFQFLKEQPLEKHIFDIIDRSVKADDSFYLNGSSVQHQKMNAAIADENQIYRFSDYGIQKSKDGISFTLKANMGAWYNRVPIIKDDFGIRAITPQECLALQRFPKSFDFPDIPIKSMYKQCGNTVVVPVVKQIVAQLL